MYFYIKALHIIFIVTWFSGLFYIVRLFVYSAEANLKAEPERTILLNQFGIMQKRLWYGITWPSAILTFIFGTWMWQLYGSMPQWLVIKLFFCSWFICLSHNPAHNIQATTTGQL
jgi:putative membrane protein